MSTNVLLDPLPPDLESTYLHELLSLMGLSEKVEVRRDAIRGRCLHAKASYKRGDLIWKEPPLVAMQHLSSAEQAPCCSHCFAYLGSCEYQIGSRLMYQIRHHKSLAERGEVDDEEVKAAREQVERIEAAGLSETDAKDLILGKIKLPMSDRFPLGAPLTCTGCGAKYCSESCQSEAWRSHHSLLCPHASEDKNRKRRRLAAHKSEGSLNVNQDALMDFYELAAETNEIFILTSRVLVTTALRADELLPINKDSAVPSSSAPSSSSSSSLCRRSHPYEAVTNLLSRGLISVNSPLEALQCAWLPFQAGWKRLWHEAVAVPLDVEDVETFRDELKELAGHASSQLRKALPGLSLKYPLLFSDEVFSSLIGMFELNNLTVSPPSPVEDFFLEVDESNDEAIKAATKPYLDALDKTYDERADGTGFFALQSLMNHECAPRVVPEWVVASASSGKGAAVASMACVKDIVPGDELSISYIDEEGLKTRERQERLRDYGFVCTCSLCSG